jgi:hypothetical protein
MTKITLKEIVINIKSDKSKRIIKVLGFILLTIFMNRDYLLHTFFRNDLIGNGLIQQRDVKRELNILVEDYKCTYVAINLFHNGSKALNGTHFKKMSREYEGKRNDKLPLTYKFKNYDIEPFSDEFLKISDNLILYIKDVDKYPNQYLRNTLKRSGYKSVLYIAIKDKDFWNNDVFNGFMTYEFDKVTNFSEADIEEMRLQYDLKLRDLIKAK